MTRGQRFALLTAIFSLLPSLLLHPDSFAQDNIEPTSLEGLVAASPITASWAPESKAALTRLMSRIDDVSPHGLPREEHLKNVEGVVRYLAQRGMLLHEGIAQGNLGRYTTTSLREVQKGFENLRDILVLVNSSGSGRTFQQLLRELPEIKEIKVSDIEAGEKVVAAELQRRKEEDLIGSATKVAKSLSDSHPTMSAQTENGQPATNLATAQTLQKPSPGVTLLIPSDEDITRFGNNRYEQLDFTFDEHGNRKTDPREPLTRFNSDSVNGQFILAYEEKLKEDADSIIEQVKAGRHVELVIELTHLLGNVSAETEALIRTFLDQRKAGLTNFWLGGIKGLQHSGIMHIKDRLGIDKNNALAAWTGSLNFSVAGSDNQFNSFGVTADPNIAQVALKNFQWIKKMAVEYNANMELQDPKVLYDEIPVYQGPGIQAFGMTFPEVLLTPVREEKDRRSTTITNKLNPLYSLIELYKRTNVVPFDAMYAEFPPSALVQPIIEMTKRLEQPMPALINYNQLHNPMAHPYTVLQLVEAGAMEVRTVAGPHFLPFDPRTYTDNKELWHMKNQFWGTIIGEILSSWNKSANATYHNYEIFRFLTGRLLERAYEFSNYVYNHGAYKPTIQELRKWIGKPPVRRKDAGDDSSDGATESPSPETNSK